MKETKHVVKAEYVTAIKILTHIQKVGELIWGESWY